MYYRLFSDIIQQIYYIYLRAFILDIKKPPEGGFKISRSY